MERNAISLSSGPAETGAGHVHPRNAATRNLGRIPDRLAFDRNGRTFNQPPSRHSQGGLAINGRIWSGARMQGSSMTKNPVRIAAISYLLRSSGPLAHAGKPAAGWGASSFS